MTESNIDENMKMVIIEDWKKEKIRKNKIFNNNDNKIIFEGKKNEKILNKNFEPIMLDYINVLTEFKINEINQYLYFTDLLIGTGTFGKVYFGLKKSTLEPIIIKKINNRTGIENYVLKEGGKMQAISKINFFPKIYDLLKESQTLYLIESIEGPDLNKFISFSEDNIDINTIYRLGVELIINLKIIHNLGYLHVDIKADNIVCFFNPKKIEEEIIHFVFIDFGWSTPYRNYEGEHLPPCHQLRKCGNFQNSSLNALEGNPISRKDDIISLVYLLFFECVKNSGINNIRAQTEEDLRTEMIKFKKNMDIKNFCKNKFPELLEIYDDANQLKFTEEPKYEKYIKILKNGIEKSNKNQKKYNYFCWEKK